MIDPRSKKASRVVNSHPEELAELIEGRARHYPVAVALAYLGDEPTLIGGATNRWEYPWTERWWNPATKLGTAKSGGLSGVAYNVNEFDNDASHLYPEADPSDIPGGFGVGPCEGHVMVRAFRASDGSLVWLFEKLNPVVGSCSGASLHAAEEVPE